MLIVHQNHVVFYCLHSVNIDNKRAVNPHEQRSRKLLFHSFHRTIHDMLAVAKHNVHVVTEGFYVVNFVERHFDELCINLYEGVVSIRGWGFCFGALDSELSWDVVEGEFDIFGFELLR